jgi:hypothetical protein
MSEMPSSWLTKNTTALGMIAAIDTRAASAWSASESPAKAFENKVTSALPRQH